MFPSVLLAMPCALVAPTAAPRHFTTELQSLLTSNVGPAPTIGKKQWESVATLLRDTACDLAENNENNHAAALAACEEILDAAKLSVPELYSVAKLSAKRNGRLSESPRAASRCLAELGLLVGTWAALEGADRIALLDAARPLSQTIPTAARLRTLTVLCRGFHSPATALPDSSGCAAGTVLDAWLTSAPQHAQQHSRVLRASLPLLDEPLKRWLGSLDASPPQQRQEYEAASTARNGAAELVRLLVETAGDEGAQLAQTAALWVVDSLFESMERPSSTGAALPVSILARARGSEVAQLLLVTHAPLVKLSARPHKRWRAAVERVGHAVWLMLQAAREARDESDPQQGTDDGSCGSDGTIGSRVLERVRAVMLACSLLERSDQLRPRFRAAMGRAHTDPAWLWQLLSTALALEVEQPEEESAGVQGPHRTVAGALGAGEVASAASRLLRWAQPELVFKYLEMHSDAALLRDPQVAPLTRRWLNALLGVSGESVHDLRCQDTTNAAHFASLEASGPAGKRAVEVWVAHDYIGCNCFSGEAMGSRGTLLDDEASRSDAASPLQSSHLSPRCVCDPERLFMLGEELRTCMRIDRQCIRENAALLGYLTQGLARILAVTDADVETSCGKSGDRSPPVGNLHDEIGSGRSERSTGHRTAVRTMVRLLGRADTGEPVIFVDQPLYGHHVSAGDNHAEDERRRAVLEARLLDEAAALGVALGVPVATWKRCVAPPVVGGRRGVGADNGDEDRPSARAVAEAWEGRVALVEFDGVAPQVYSNLRGRLIRGTDEARAIVTPADGKAQARSEDQVDERAVVHALADVALLESDIEI